MGIFSGFKSGYKKSRAVAVVKDLLEVQSHAGLLTEDSTEFANLLVTSVWDNMPDVFGGKFGQRPHKISVAAFALANGLRRLPAENENKAAIAISLGNVLSELQTNGNSYPLNSLDHELLGTAAEVFMEAGSELLGNDTSSDSNGAETLPNFEDWYEEFKTEAGRINPILTTSESGDNLIDFMDHGPLENAYSDGMDPKVIAKHFAQSFDINSFGTKG